MLGTMASGALACEPCLAEHQVADQ
jgi:hypothetical protein